MDFFPTAEMGGGGGVYISAFIYILLMKFTLLFFIDVCFKIDV
jgi:hypothetical protein